MAIEKRKLDGSEIGPEENYQGKTLDWDTDLGGPIIHIPPEAQPIAAHRYSDPDTLVAISLPYGNTTRL